MHQLRVHLAAIGHPLLGDPLYDPEPSGRAGTGPAPFLRAVRIVWEDPPGRAGRDGLDVRGAGV